MHPKDSFGEQALFNNSSTRKAAIKADTDVKLLSLSRDSIQSILGKKV